MTTCKECGCRTGGGDYCYQHAPYTVWPLKDGSFRSDRNGLTHIWLVPPPSVQTEGMPARACPCLHTAPCSARCSCVTPLSSSGCTRCCAYGSPEQQRAQAERLVRAGIDFLALTRFEVIDERGRDYRAYDCQVEASVQDEGRTLKLFVKARTP